MTTASDVWMSIIILLERRSAIFSFLNPEFFGNAANVGLRCFVLNGESADVPNDIVVDWSLRYPLSATATLRKPFPVWTILSCIAVGVCCGGHIHVT